MSLNCDTLLNNYFSNLNIGGILSVGQTYGTVTASFLAAIGLLYGDYSVVLGAMLVSPMGSPLRYAALTLLKGKSHNLIKVLFMLVAMTIISFVIGMLAIVLNNVMNLFTLPTVHMEKLSDSLFLRVNFILGCISGLATPYAIKNNNTLIMAGLFISVAILPPMVNSGMFMALALYEKDEHLKKEYMTKSGHSAAITVANWLGLGISSLIGFKLLC